MIKKFKSVLYLICFIFLSALLFFSVFKKSYFNVYTLSERIIIQDQNILLLFATLSILCILFLFLVRLNSFLDKYPYYIAVTGILVFSILIKVIFVFLFPTLPSADQLTVFEIGKEYAMGNTSGFTNGGYLTCFPNNLGITLFLSLIYRLFSDYLMMVKLINILLSTITAFFTYLIFKETKSTSNNMKISQSDLVVLVLSSFFLPSILMNNFIYNDIIATTFFTAAIYFVIRFKKVQKIQYIIATGVLLSMGNFFRGIGTLFLVAFMVYILINLKNIKIILSSAVILLLFINLVPYGTLKALENKGISKESLYKNDAPLSLWIYMGMDKESSGFWDMGKSFNIYLKDAGQNKELAKVLYNKEITKRVKDLGVEGLISVYAKKTFWMWTEGTYQLDWYGIGYSKTRGGYLYKTFAQDIIKDNSSYRESLMWVMYSTNLLMLFFFALGILINLKKSDFQSDILVLIMGVFVVFYFVWEIKSRYAFSCYPIFIILAYRGCEELYQLTFHKAAVDLKNTIRDHNNHNFSKLTSLIRKFLRI